MLPEAIFFDCDGVLVDSELLANQIWHKEVLKTGWNMSLEESMERFMGLSSKLCLEKIREAGYDPSGVKEAFDKKIQAAIQNAEVKAIPGIHELLTYIQSINISFALVSSAELKKVGLCLASTKLAHFFPENRRFTCPELGVHKPDPDIYLLAAKALDVDPTKCIAIEDSPTGATAAVRAGMTTYQYLPGGQESIEGAIVLRRMEEMVKHLS